MNWETIGSIILGLGFLSMLVGFSIKLWPGRWFSGLLAVVLITVVLLSGDWESLASEDISPSSHKASRLVLAGGVVCFLVGGAIMLIAKSLT